MRCMGPELAHSCLASPTSSSEFPACHEAKRRRSRVPGGKGIRGRAQWIAI
jgi:hypothetical protein